MKVEVSSFARPDAQQIKCKLWGKKKKHPKEDFNAFIQKKKVIKVSTTFHLCFPFFLFLIKLRLLKIWFLLPQIQNTRQARNVSIPACLSAPAVAITQKSSSNKTPPEDKEHVFCVWTWYQMEAEVHKSHSGVQSKDVKTEAQIKTSSCPPQQITQETIIRGALASRTERAEAHLQMERRSCWGGRGQAASGTDTPDTLVSCTCLHLGASTLRNKRETP